MALRFGVCIFFFLFFVLKTLMHFLSKRGGDYTTVSFFLLSCEALGRNCFSGMDVSNKRKDVACSLIRAGEGGDESMYSNCRGRLKPSHMLRVSKRAGTSSDGRPPR